MKKTSEVTHTPGPWKESYGREAFSVDAAERPVAWIHFWADTTFKTKIRLGEQQANARLIAAAPELLEACIQVLDASEDNGDMDDIDWNGLRAAVAKAEGKTT